MSRLMVFLAVAWASLVAAFMGLPEVVRALLILMGVDVILGAANAWTTGTLTSGRAWSGITKKVAILGIIVLAKVVEPLIAPELSLPLAQAVGAYYVFVESISILENAGEVGIPIPDFLRSALAVFSKPDSSGASPQG